MSKKRGKSAASLDSLMKAVEGLTEKLESQLTSLKRDLNTAISAVTNDVIHVKDDLKSVHSNIVDLRKENIMLKTWLTGLETYSRRDNLWFVGIPEKKTKIRMLSLVFLPKKPLHITDSGDIKFVRIHKNLPSETQETQWNHFVLPLLRWSTVSARRGLNWRALDVMSVRICPRGR